MTEYLMARPDLGAQMSGAEPFTGHDNNYGRFLRLLKQERPDARIRLRSGKFLRLANGHVEDRDGYPDDDWVYGTMSDADEAELNDALALLAEVQS